MKKKLLSVVMAAALGCSLFAGGVIGTGTTVKAEPRYYSSGYHTTPESAVVVQSEEDHYIIRFYDSTDSSSWAPNAWFSYTASADGYLEVTLQTRFYNSCTWYICDADERVIGNYDSNGTISRTFKIGIRKGKTIYIRSNIPNQMYDVYNYSTLDYKFYEGEGYESEPNNTLSQVTYMTLGKSYHVFTLGDEDEEFFGAQLAKNHTYRLTVDRKGFETASPRIYLRGVGGSPSSQIQITQSFEYDALKDEYSCTFTPLEGGMQYIYIKEAASDGEYDISLSYVSAPITGQTMFRLYNPNSGEHFYTAEVTERNTLISAGWKDEGVAWTAPTSSNTPVYRLYNPNSGEHHYTTGKVEKDYLVSIGWKDEGIGWYSDDNQGTALYRLYNPNATGAQEAGGHHYTKDVNEKNSLITAGWRDEGIGWYGI